MADGGLIKAFYEETTCSVCLEYFKDPVMVVDCGHNFCQACLTQCCEEMDKTPSCPQCRKVLQQKNFKPNRQLANLVELVKKLQVGKGAEGKWRGCERHQEPLKLFCFNDQDPICLVCDRSMGHQNHKVLPMEEAFLEYKKEIQDQLQSLEQERGKLQKQKTVDDQRSQKFLKKLKKEKNKTKSAFQKLHNYLEKEERLMLSQLEEMEEEMAKRDEENHARFSEEVSHLSDLIREMEEKFQQSEDDFFQNPKTILIRYVKEPERQLLEPPLELEEALKTYTQKTPALEQALGKSQGSLKYAVEEALYKALNRLDPGVSGDHLLRQPIQSPSHNPAGSRTGRDRGRRIHPVNMTLDSKTAHPNLIVSSDMKSMKWGSSRGKCSAKPEQFDTVFGVLGHEKFTSGRLCWVVEVGNGRGEWAVGVARESVKRKGNITLNPDEGFWIMKAKFESWMNCWKIHAFSSPQSVILSAIIPQKILVSLDYEEGRVEFFSAETKQKLFAFRSTSFSGEALRPYFSISEQASLTCCS